MPELHTFPGVDELRCLINCFSANDLPVNEIKIVNREPMEQGVNLSEIVDCTLGNDENIRLFCKYEAVGVSDRKSNSHRVGVEYEASIYNRILSRYNVSAPRYIGSGILEKSNMMMMILEYLEGYSNVSVENKEEVGLAASAIANIHKELEGRVPSFVRTYSGSFFLYWMNDFRNILEEASIEETWLFELCDYFKENINVLMDGPLTLVHGEYYTKNILSKDGHICPIDWESAACGMGELDLAPLVDNRPHGEYCIEQYIASRWEQPGSHLEAFHKRLTMARLYFYFRWLSKKRHKGIKSFIDSEWVSVGMKKIGMLAGCY